MKIEILTEIYQNSLKELLQTSFDCKLDDFFHRLNENYICLVAIINNTVVGHILICKRQNIMRNYAYYELQFVCVKEEYKRHQIASRMLQKCEELGRQDHIHHIEFTSGNQRVAAHACYHKNGYVIRDSAIFIKEIMIEK